MESDVTQTAFFFKLWAWVDSHRKQILWGAIAVVLAIIVVGFSLWRKNQTQADANDALSRTIAQGMLSGQPIPADAFLKVAADYPRTSAAGRALLLAAARYFDDGKYPEARAQFEKYLHDDANGPFAGQARLGVAACQAASGQAAEAISNYKEIASRYPADVAGAVAQLALGRLYESQGNFIQALDSYARVARPEYSLLASEAQARKQDLEAQHPELQVPLLDAPTTSTNTPAPSLLQP